MLITNQQVVFIPTSSWSYHLPDALGSVRQLTDGTGTLSLSRAYEPFGEPLSTQGGGGSSYGYTGGSTEEPTPSPPPNPSN